MNTILPPSIYNSYNFYNKSLAAPIQPSFVSSSELYFGQRQGKVKKRIPRLATMAVVSLLLGLGGSTAATYASSKVDSAKQSRDSAVRTLDEINNQTKGLEGKKKPLTIDLQEFRKAQLNYKVTMTLESITDPESPKRLKQLELDKIKFKKTLQLLLQGRPDLQEMLREFPNKGFELTIVDTPYLKKTDKNGKTVDAWGATTCGKNSAPIMELASANLTHPDDPMVMLGSGNVLETFIHETMHLFDCLKITPGSSSGLKAKVSYIKPDGLLPGLSGKDLHEYKEERAKYKQVLRDKLKHKQYVATGDGYVLSSDAEFLAETVRAFFTDPQGLQEQSPGLFKLYSKYFNVKPDYSRFDNLLNEGSFYVGVANKNYPNASLLPYPDVINKINDIEMRLKDLKTQKRNALEDRLLKDKRLSDWKTIQVLLYHSTDLLLIIPAPLLTLTAFQRLRKREKHGH